MCREAVLNIVCDASRFYYAFGIRPSYDFSEVTPSIALLLHSSLMKVMPNRLNREQHNMPRIVEGMSCDSTEYNEPRNRRTTPNLPPIWPPHVTPDQAVEPDQHVPGGNGNST